MRREIVLPSPHGHQAPQIKTPWPGSVVKSSWPDRRPPKLLLHMFTTSGASRMFELSHTLLKSRSNIARNSSPLSAENSARKASKRWSHRHDKTPHEAHNNSLQIFSSSDFLRCIIKMQGHYWPCQYNIPTIISQHPSMLLLQQTLEPCLPQYISLPLSADFCLYELFFQPL